jgi:hypothetical protein
MDILSQHINCFNTQNGNEDDIIEYLNQDDNNIIIGIEVYGNIIIYCENMNNFEQIEIQGNIYYINERIGNFIISEDDFFWFENFDNRLFLLSLQDEQFSEDYNLCNVKSYTIDEYRESSGINELELLALEEE